MLASMFALTAANFPFLPDRLPSHWTGGTVDSFAAKSTVLWLWPLLAAATYASFLTAARRHDAGGQPEPVLWWARTLLAAGALVICCGRLAAYWGFGLQTGLSFGVVLMIVGAAMPAIIRDRLAGSPTRRDLRNEPSWVRSYRRCGQALLVSGPILIGGSLLGVSVSTPVALAAVGAGAVALKAYANLKW